MVPVLPDEGCFLGAFGGGADEAGWFQLAPERAALAVLMADEFRYLCKASAERKWTEWGRRFRRPCAVFEGGEATGYAGEGILQKISLQASGKSAYKMGWILPVYGLRSNQCN